VLFSFSAILCRTFAGLAHNNQQQITTQKNQLTKGKKRAIFLKKCGKSAA
jgi:cell fate (sporulation/competence/biofilm development) regulator YmcA (YheA/YmcA/DUF963 family)